MDDADNQQDLIIYHTADGKAAVSLHARDGNIWMNQSQLAELFATSKQNISLHIANILKEKELPADSVIKDYLTTATDGKRDTLNSQRQQHRQRCQSMGDGNNGQCALSA